MAQYDAYPNPNPVQRAAFPFLVVIQSDQLAHFGTRLVVPLVRLPRAPADMPRRLSEAILVNGERLFPAVHLCAAVPSRVLREPVASLAAQAGILRDALDALVAGV